MINCEILMTKEPSKDSVEFFKAQGIEVRKMTEDTASL